MKKDGVPKAAPSILSRLRLARPGRDDSLGQFVVGRAHRLVILRAILLVYAHMKRRVCEFKNFTLQLWVVGSVASNKFARGGTDDLLDL